VHVGLRASADLTLWEYARQHDLVIVTKDEDFHRLSVMHGPPPKVVWIRLGNCSTDDIVRLMLKRRADVESFLLDEEVAFLALA
jgi:predicted nuclease of predicted toxin-antitoxin system